MPATIEQITEFLEAEGLECKIEDGFIRTVFRTSTYRNGDGDPVVGIVVVLDDLENAGEFLKVIAPNVYNYSDGPHKAALFQLLLMISWDTKMIQYEYDAGDGEVRAIVEFPIADSTLTMRQFMYCLHGITTLIDENHEAVVAAMTKGELPKREENNAEMAALWREFQEFVEQKKRSAGGSADDHGLPS